MVLHRLLVCTAHIRFACTNAGFTCLTTRKADCDDAQLVALAQEFGLDH